jgi:hypothetical protein
LVVGDFTEVAMSPLLEREAIAEERRRVRSGLPCIEEVGWNNGFNGASEKRIRSCGSVHL